MSYAIDFITYTDIHHYKYTNGITENDIISVEEHVRKEAADRNVDFILFTGDRFASRNPTDEIKCAADKELRRTNDLGKPYIALLGNHDRYTKSPFSGHTWSVVDLWRDQLSNILVMDDRKKYSLTLPNGLVVEFQAIPADHELAAFPFQFGSAHFRICAFHNIVRGSKIDGGQVAMQGITMESMDLAAFDIVIGGDNHVPQELPLKNTVGMYTGAPLQHGWGDMGQNRGLYHVHIEKNADGSLLKLDREFIRTKTPQFVKTVLGYTDEASFLDDLALCKHDFSNNIVHLILQGMRETISNVSVQALTEKAKSLTGARLIKLFLEPMLDYHEPIVGMGQVKTPQEDIELLLSSSNYDVGELDRKKLIQMGKSLLDAVGGK